MDEHDYRASQVAAILVLAETIERSSTSHQTARMNIEDRYEHYIDELSGQ